MTEAQILKIVKEDYESAKEAKTGVDGKIQTWLDEYNGEPYGNESDGHSQMVVKDIKKAVEWFLPNAVEPFVGKNRIVKLEGITADDVDRANIAEKLLNYQFVRNFDRYSFMYDCFKVGATEGTTVVKCGWELEEDVMVEKLDTWTPEQLIELEATGAEISINEETNVATITKRKTIVNKPTAVVVRNGRFFIDPTADSVKNADYTVEEIDVTMSSLKKDDIYKNLDELGNGNYERDDSNTEVARGEKGSDLGYDADSKSGDNSLKKMTMHEYWGNLDINDDGVALPVVVSWIGNTLVRYEENPYPDKEKPYVATAFTKTPFMFWGEALAEFISDGQFIRSGIMRAMLDNVAQSNNGFKFFRKGALDPFNKKKLLSGIGGAIEINGDASDMWDGNFNQMPQTIFNMFEMLQRENESLSGVSNAAQGLDSRALSTATSANLVSSMGQKRMMEIVRRYSEDIVKALMRKWISYNKVYLNPQEVIRISGNYIEFTPDDIDGAYDIDITVGVDGIEEAKANQITMLMQQIGGLAGTVDPKTLHSLLAKLADIWGFADVAAELEAYEQPAPDPIQAQLAQLEMEKLQAEIEKLKSETHENMSQANNNNTTAKLRAYGLTEDTDKDNARDERNK